jgi:cyclopropane fatty-acyl-phospholipid synthase-like methyltransferase
MSGVSKFIEQCQKPSGWWGRFTLWRMNVSHSKLTDWGLGHIAIEKKATILDVGCGGGSTVRKLAAATAEGTIYGVDHSEESVAAAKRNNVQGIENGRVEILQGSVSQ